MQNSELIKWLNQDLIQRISRANMSEPFVWKLKLSSTDFKELESAITKCITENNGSYGHLISPGSAWFVMVYLAEWYKRCYFQGEKNSGHKAINPDSVDLKRLWEHSGIDINTFVYTTESGDHLWQYSIYVLGGLAIRHELGGKKNKSFLKQLCRLLHQENGIIDTDEFKDDNRAISFRESIISKHSLYQYLNEIVIGNFPFHEEDLEHPSSETKLFINAILDANKSVISDKFDFEWVVRHALENETMERWLQVNLRPELLGRGLHEELHFGRLSKWGIQNPESIKLSCFIRFLDGDNCIYTSSPFIHYWSTGDNEPRLIKWGAGIPKVKDIPMAHFDTIEIVAKDVVTNKLYENIQKESVSEYMQLWRIDDFNDEWSSKKRSQKDTAVLFSDACSLTEIGADEIIRKPFRGKISYNTVPLNWYYIEDSVTLVDHLGEQVRLYNRQGYDHLRITNYDSIIHYLEGGYIECSFLDEDGMEETAQLPPVFSQQDIRAIHYESREAEEPDADTKPELLQFMSLDSTRYLDWTEENIPPFGLLNIRAYIKGKEFKTRVFHLPSYSPDLPIIRDFTNSRIYYAENRNGVHSQMCYQDEIVLDKKKQLSPSVQLSIYVSENSYTIINIFRPTLIKELLVDGSVIRYIQDGEKLNLPYILKYRSSINDLSRNGYRKYNCSFISSIYNQMGTKNDEHLDAWSKGGYYQAIQLDKFAPPWLNIVFGDKETSKQPAGNIYYWDYKEESRPEQNIPDLEKMAETSLLFESMVRPNEQLACMYPKTRQNPFGYNSDSVSIVKCFETAVKHKTYFFIFWPLSVQLKKHEYVTKVYGPLLNLRNGCLTEQDVTSLKRFEEEFRFEWKEIGIIL
jgi:hypothetical protein